MNIFILDRNPTIAAELHNNTHVRNQLLESTQMLSTCMHLQTGSGPYKIAHKDHPCTKWANRHQAHYSWLYDLYLALAHQYTLRYNKIHACERLKDILYRPKTNYDNIEFEQVMPPQYKHPDPVIAYKNYYLWGKRHIAKWKNTQPNWYINDNLT